MTHTCITFALSVRRNPPQGSQNISLQDCFTILWQINKFIFEKRIYCLSCPNHPDRRHLFTACICRSHLFGNIFNKLPVCPDSSSENNVINITFSTLVYDIFIDIKNFPMRAYLPRRVRPNRHQKTKQKVNRKNTFFNQPGLNQRGSTLLEAIK